MANRSSEARQQIAKRTATPFAHQNWRLPFGVAVVVLGTLMLLLNFSDRTATPRSISTPIVVRDGLIVKGSGPQLYLFKRYALHQIIDPTIDQQAQARPVTDDFLAQYAHGQPVDPKGLPLPQLPTNTRSSSPHLSGVNLLATAPYSALWAGLAGVIVFVGSGWLLTRIVGPHQAGAPSQPTPAIRQAAIYTEQIERLLKANPNHQQQQLLTRVCRWQQAIEDIAHCVAAMHQDEIILDDLDNVPEVIADLERRLSTESNPNLRAPLKNTLTRRQSQLMALEQLQTITGRAEIQIETTVAVLGTIYSKLLANQSIFQVADYSRLLDEVDEEVQCLQDHLEALREVKLGQQ